MAVNKRHYWVWSAMVQRCHNPNNRHYCNYGARGIYVCERWRFYENFLQDMGTPAPGLHLDRKDNNKGYSKDNCRWVVRLSNNKNKRMYKTNKTKISGVEERGEKFRVRLRHQGNIVVDRTVGDFFEACCIRKSAENTYVTPYL